MKVVNGIMSSQHIPKNSQHLECNKVAPFPNLFDFISVTKMLSQSCSPKTVITCDKHLIFFFVDTKNDFWEAHRALQTTKYSRYIYITMERMFPSPSNLCWRSQLSCIKRFVEFVKFWINLIWRVHSVSPFFLCNYNCFLNFFASQLQC